MVEGPGVGGKQGEGGLQRPRALQEGMLSRMVFPTRQKLWSPEHVGGQAEQWHHGGGTAGHVETPSREQLLEPGKAQR